MKAIKVSRNIYSNGEKLIYFKKELDKTQKRLEFLQGKVEELTLLDPEEYQDQDWSAEPIKKN